MMKATAPTAEEAKKEATAAKQVALDAQMTVASTEEKVKKIQGSALTKENVEDIVSKKMESMRVTGGGTVTT
eukprot:8616722-Pyramimonas_sp.AAC.1